MPQMFPMNWIILIIYFLMIFLIFNIMSYYIYMPLMKKINHFKFINKKTFNWKW
uniref:ATP synthase complex subunit 8 n=1 Tax=Hymenoptera sp. 4 GYN-2021 TaxID=2876101 RepID=A0A977TL97_9HYME|nr:ATP synthase F0 subunit 8 [Hymenoptera sp. 4 GYN-2021]